ncbi:MAG: hypothetical protein Q7S22_08175 [Candidatus Micrarchaeota archaeon]|nr:hypothetical protein [Candidatus Micrarchaeota archaeon]
MVSKMVDIDDFKRDLKRLQEYAENPKPYLQEIKTINYTFNKNRYALPAKLREDFDEVLRELDKKLGGKLNLGRPTSEGVSLRTTGLNENPFIPQRREGTLVKPGQAPDISVPVRLGDYMSSKQFGSALFTEFTSGSNAAIPMGKTISAKLKEIGNFDAIAEKVGLNDAKEAKAMITALEQGKILEALRVNPNVTFGPEMVKELTKLFPQVEVVIPRADIMLSAGQMDLFKDSKTGIIVSGEAAIGLLVYDTYKVNAKDMGGGKYALSLTPTTHPDITGDIGLAARKKFDFTTLKAKASLVRENPAIAGSMIMGRFSLEEQGEIKSYPIFHAVLVSIDTTGKVKAVGEVGVAITDRTPFGVKTSGPLVAFFNASVVGNLPTGVQMPAADFAAGLKVADVYGQSTPEQYNLAVYARYGLAPRGNALLGDYRGGGVELDMKRIGVKIGAEAGVTSVTVPPAFAKAVGSPEVSRTPAQFMLTVDIGGLVNKALNLKK